MSGDLQTQSVYEMDWGPNDLLVVSTERLLTTEQRESLRSSLKGVGDKEGRQIIVLEAGFQLTVLHKTAEMADADMDDEAPMTYMDGTPGR